jgi:hypothetical protein
MRLARALTVIAYASTAVVAAIVLSAPWWRPADGDLSFGFFMAGLFAIWLQLTLAVAVVGLLAGLWTVAINRAERTWQHMTTLAGAALAVVGLSVYAWYFLHS